MAGVTTTFGIRRVSDSASARRLPGHADDADRPGQIEAIEDAAQLGQGAVGTGQPRATVTRHVTTMKFW